MKNIEIRQAIAKKRLRFYEVANALGITCWTFSVWLRSELPQEKKEEILKVIDSMQI